MEPKLYGYLMPRRQTYIDGLSLWLLQLKRSFQIFQLYDIALTIPSARRI